jgi:hypothetical protein
VVKETPVISCGNFKKTSAVIRKKEVRRQKSAFRRSTPKIKFLGFLIL